MAEQLVIDAFELPKAVDEDRLTVDVGSWEGPLDLLLTLARSQKVDLREISILALVDQYLAFINDAKALKLELAADYLVMAAWLAYLKSGLLLPKDPEIEPSPEELAMRLQLRLERLNAMRDAGARLMGRDLVNVMSCIDGVSARVRLSERRLRALKALKRVLRCSRLSASGRTPST